MSPLACSLLALVALLAAVSVVEGCGGNSVLIGQETSMYITVPAMNIPAGGGRLHIPDLCYAQYGNYLVGESVQACNSDPYGAPPNVVPTDYRDPRQPVDVMCPDWCRYGATAYVVQYCSNY